MSNKKRPVDLGPLFEEMTDCEFARENSIEPENDIDPADYIPADDDCGGSDMRQYDTAL